MNLELLETRQLLATAGVDHDDMDDPCSPRRICKCPTPNNWVAVERFAEEWVSYGLWGVGGGAYSGLQAARGMARSVENAFGELSSLEKATFIANGLAGAAMAGLELYYYTIGQKGKLTLAIPVGVTALTLWETTNILHTLWGIPSQTAVMESLIGSVVGMFGGAGVFFAGRLLYKEAMTPLK